MKFRVLDGQRLVQVDHDVVSTDTTDFSASFKLNNLFTGTVTSYWMIAGESDVYKSVLSSSGSCTAPWEVFAAKGNGRSDEVDHVVYVSLADAGRTTTSRCEIRVFKSAYAAESSSSGQMPSDAYQDLVDMINAGQLRGESAYEAAVELGFAGTKEEWIKSLEGKKGEPFTLQDFMETDTYQSIIKATEDADAAAMAANEAAAGINGEIQRLDAAITKNTERDKTMNRRVDALFKLGEGITHQFEEDAAAAYEKTVPTGAKLASVKQIGGKTVAWNQMLNEGSFVYSIYGVDPIIDNHKLSIVGTTTQGSNYIFHSNLKLIKDHKYYIGDFSSVFGMTLHLHNFTTSEHFAFAEYDSGSIIYTHSLETGRFQIYFNNSSGCEVNIVGIPQVFDLTKMFGAGNEPATVGEFEAMFPDDYYPYNKGELLSAPVSEVVEQGKNLWNPNNEYDKFYDFYLPKGMTLFVAFKTNYDASVFSVLYDDGSNEGWYINSNIYEDGYRKRYITLNKNILAIKVYGSYHPTDVFVSTKGFDEITPYHKTSHPISQSILDLPGYGWSAGDVHNYVDLENKKYHKRVGKVDLGQIEWIRKKATNGMYWFESKIGCANVTVGETPKILNSYGYNTVSCKDLIDDTLISDKDICNTTTTNTLILRNDVYTDAETFKTDMSGVMLYYQLATEEIADISDLLPEDFLASMEVEPGGTLTFKNSNGDGYRLPVPNTEEYIVKLSELGGETA